MLLAGKLLPAAKRILTVIIIRVLIRVLFMPVMQKIMVQLRIITYTLATVLMLPIRNFLVVIKPSVKAVQRLRYPKTAINLIA